MEQILYTKKQVATMFGVSPKTIQRKVKPTCYIGIRPRYLPEDATTVLNFKPKANAGHQ